MGHFRACICETHAFTFGPHLSPDAVFHSLATIGQTPAAGIHARRLPWQVGLGVGHPASGLPVACLRAAAPPTPAASSNELPEATSSPCVRQLLAQTTLEEKIGQMFQPAGTASTPPRAQQDVALDPAKAGALVWGLHAGSFLSGEAVPAVQWVRQSAALQRIARRGARLQISIAHGIDHMQAGSQAVRFPCATRAAAPGSTDALTLGR